MMEKLIQVGPWIIGYILSDGARISRLQYGSINILTQEPIDFKPPRKDYGLYETRPVYGYDDCFPSVDECTYPHTDWIIPDHGELCWLPWEVEQNADTLIFQVKSHKLPVWFIRRLTLCKNRLVWSFSVENIGDKTLPFQHVMHPLMPLNTVTDIHLPAFSTVFDAIKKMNMCTKDPETVRQYLLSQPSGSTNMLFLQNITNGKMSWNFLNLLQIEATFPLELFPSIGIWWNNDGYPDENGCRRNECALEPVPGFNSILSDAYENKLHLAVGPGKKLEWDIVWHVSS